MMARLKALEEENRRLKKRYAEACLKAEIVQEALQKKWPGKRYSNAVSVFDWPALPWVSVKPVTGISHG